MCATSAARRYAGSRSRPRRRRCTRTPSAGSPPFSPAMRGRAFFPPTSTRATTACTYRRSSPPPPPPPAARAARGFSNLPRAALGRDREPQRERRVRRRPPPLRHVGEHPRGRSRRIQIHDGGARVERRELGRGHQADAHAQRGRECAGPRAPRRRERERRVGERGVKSRA